MRHGEKILWIIYFVLVALGLLLFLPIRDGVYLPYSVYSDWGTLFALGFTIIALPIIWISVRGNSDKKETILFMAIGSIALLFVLLLLFTGIQWIHEHIMIV